jgi:hypothetical protein
VRENKLAGQIVAGVVVGIILLLIAWWFSTPPAPKVIVRPVPVLPFDATTQKVGDRPGQTK